MDRDEELACIARARDGSEQAFQALIEAHADRLFNYLRVRGLGHADAEDALQETFLKAFRYLSRYQPRWRFSTWLYTIALRESATQRRRSGREPMVDPPAPQASPMDHCTRAQTRDNLWPLARRVLSDEQFSALWLHYGEDFATAEIAETMGRSRVWVKVNLHRARRKLQAAIERVPGGPDRNTDHEPVRT